VTFITSRLCGRIGDAVVREPANLTPALPVALAMKLGHPFSTGTRMGPVVSDQQRTDTLDHVEKGKSEEPERARGGARLAIDTEGRDISPGRFLNTRTDMATNRAAIFAPPAAASARAAVAPVTGPPRPRASSGAKYPGGVRKNSANFFGRGQRPRPRPNLVRPEPVGAMTVPDGRAGCITADERAVRTRDGAVPVARLRRIVGDVHGWALSVDRAARDALAWIRDVFEEKLVPRLGARVE
jgi:hypothetical protein